MRHLYALTLILAASAGQADAQALNAEALREIDDFAKSFCGDYVQEGSADTFSAQGNAKAELDGLLKKLASIGIEGAAKFDTGEYVGVLREELGGELKSVRDCRLKIWSDLKAGVIDQALQPATAPAPAAAPAPAPASTPAPAPQTTGYLYPFTATALLAPADLAGFGQSDLRVMRNEIYARHGLIFASADLRALFGAMSWYQPVTPYPEAAWAAMSPLEQANVLTIKAAEGTR